MSDIAKRSAGAGAGSQSPAGAARNAQANRKYSGVATWVTHIETSGCGACAQSIVGILAAQNAESLRAQGIQFARSPRHANVVLLTGALTTQARDAVNRLLATIPEPRALVAVGNCAIDGCVFAGSDALAPSLAERLDVNVEIAGCPPSPQAILAAIGEAQRLLAGADDDAPETAGSAAAGKTGASAMSMSPRSPLSALSSATGATGETLAELVEAGSETGEMGDLSADDEETGE